MLFCYPEHQPYNWQREEMYRFAGHTDPSSPYQYEYNQATPYLYNLIAANGSGKDTYFITPCAIWFILCNTRARFIVTTSSHAQMKTQTFKYIAAMAEAFNNEITKRGQKAPLEVREFNITNIYNGSEIQAFVTDEAGRVEGFHPFGDYPAGKMVICINEAKSIRDEIFNSFSRFTGFSHWLQISSPGTKQGTFYRVCQRSREDRCILGVNFRRRVTAFDCPNITAAHIKKVKEDHGEHHYIYQTSILANFYDSEHDVVIPEELITYSDPPSSTYNLFPAAGLDIALGGDESWLVVIHGNTEIHSKCWNIADANKLHVAIKNELDLCKSRYNLDLDNVNADGSGIGNPIIARLRDDGYDINAIRNDMAAQDKNYYLNLGAEMWFRVKRLFEMRVLVPPKHPKLRDQLTSRKYVIRETDQKIKLESKLEARSRGAHSPDYADAYVLALARYPLDELLKERPVDAPQASREQFFADLQANPEKQKAFEQKHLDRMFNNPGFEDAAREEVTFNVGISHLMYE